MSTRSASVTGINAPWSSDQKGLFFPGKHDDVTEVRKLIRVEPHEVAVVRDTSGAGGAGSARGGAAAKKPRARGAAYMLAD